MRIALPDQIAALEKALDAAERAIFTVTFGQAEADATMAGARAALDTLKWLQAHEAEIREDVRSART